MTIAAEREKLLYLALDALDRDMPDLAIMYRTSYERMGKEMLERAKERIISEIEAAQRRSIDPPISGEI